MPAQQEALRDQLAVCVDDEASRDAEVGGEYPRRRHPGVRRESAGADGGAQPVAQLAVQRFGTCPVQLDEELGTAAAREEQKAAKWYPKQP